MNVMSVAYPAVMGRATDSNRSSMAIVYTGRYVTFTP